MFARTATLPRRALVAGSAALMTLTLAAGAAHAGQTETDIENSILTRARQLRLSNIRG